MDFDLTGDQQRLADVPAADPRRGRLEIVRPRC